MLLPHNADSVKGVGEHPEGESNQKVGEDSQDVGRREKCEDSEDEDDPIRLEME
jgi:hypothetical protein